MNTQELKKGKFKEKIRELGWAFFNIYLVNLHFCWCQEKIPLEKALREGSGVGLALG